MLRIRYLPFYLLSLLPLPVMRAGGWMLYVLSFHLFRYRRTVVRTNLKRAFPLDSPAEHDRREGDFYRHFSNLFLMASKVLTVSPRKARKLLAFRNMDLIEGHYAQGHSVILYGAHMGNWEWFAFFPLHIQHQFVSFYQEQSSRYFNGLSVLMRERFGNICLESRTAYKNLVDMNRRGIRTLTFMLADQSPMAKSSKSWQTFLEQDTAFLMGAARIAVKLGHRVVYPYVRMPRPNHYEIEFIEIENNGVEEAIVEQYAHLLERNIREQSELWLWSHRRWKISLPKELKRSNDGGDTAAL